MHLDTLLILATTVPVEVRQPISVRALPRIEVIDSGWVIFSALASTAVAAFTGWLAYQTRGLAKETKRVADETARLSGETLESIRVAREAIAAEDRRHADGFLPHIAIRVKSGLFEYDQGIRRRWVVVTAKNIGSGLAWRIEARHGNATTGEVVVSDPPTALAVGEEVELVRRFQEAHVDLLQYELTYEDTFGNRFQSSMGVGIRVGSRYDWRRL
jgi:hypothetical protein